MKLSLIMAASLVALTAACAASDEVDEPAAAEAESEVNAASAKPIEAGKYVSRGRVLMVYGACSGENFLGDDAAKGAIEKGILRAPEGDVCGGYSLTTTSRGVVQVKWKVDPTASAHRDAAIAKGCRANEGTYEMTQGSAYVDPTPNVYLRGAKKLVIHSGCSVPSTLGDAVKSVITPDFVDGKPKAILRAVEGNVCSAYTLEPTNGGLKVTWLPAEGASVNRDPEIVKYCKSEEGVYAPR